jgi:hypothetical protein
MRKTRRTWAALLGALLPTLIFPVSASGYAPPYEAAASETNCRQGVQTADYLLGASPLGKCSPSAAADRTTGRLALDASVDSGVSGTAPGRARAADTFGSVRVSRTLASKTKSVLYTALLRVDAFTATSNGQAGHRAAAYILVEDGDLPRAYRMSTDLVPGRDLAISVLDSQPSNGRPVRIHVGAAATADVSTASASITLPLSVCTPGGRPPLCISGVYGALPARGAASVSLRATVKSITAQDRT